MGIADMIRDWVTEYGPIDTDDTFQPGRFGVVGRDRLLRLADMVERLERREWPTDRNNMPFTVGDRIFLEHNRKVRTVTSLMLQDKGVWIVGCDSGGAFLWPESKDNVTLLDDGSEETTAPTKCSASCTPEQAVEATLGCGTCRLTSAPQYGEGCQECSSCGAVLDGYLFDGGRCPNCRAKVVDE